MNPEQFKQTLSDKGIHLTDEQMNQFARYHDILVEWNEKMNLTAITDRDEVYLKHFYDSLTAAFYMDFSKEISICDVGAGAGFPGIPLKIVYPHLRLTIVDSLKKRITFLDHLTSELNLQGVECIHARAETIGRDPQKRARYDVVTARAVAKLTVLSELCLPMCKEGGIFLALKGTKGSKEVKDAHKAIDLLGGAPPLVHSFVLPEEDSERSIIIIKKEQRTPKKYPRKPGIPAKTPIQ